MINLKGTHHTRLLQELSLVSFLKIGDVQLVGRPSHISAVRVWKWQALLRIRVLDLVPIPLPLVKKVFWSMAHFSSSSYFFSLATSFNRLNKLLRKYLNAMYVIDIVHFINIFLFFSFVIFVWANQMQKSHCCNDMNIPFFCKGL